MQTSDFTTLFLEEIKRRIFEENFPRMRKCLSQLSEAEIWQRPNENSNSMGNLALHLCGNLRQWIVSGLGGAKDVRNRQQEFDERGPIALEIILDKIDAIEKDIAITLEKITLEDLLKVHSVQIYEENGISILVHAVEHFSYHVGQMTYFVKALKDMDMGYYAGEDLG